MPRCCSEAAQIYWHAGDSRRKWDKQVSNQTLDDEKSTSLKSFSRNGRNIVLRMMVHGVVATPIHRHLKREA